MRNWLTIELVLGVLLVSSFTSIGLLALWAATSPRHWCLRTMFTLAVLSVLMLIPAYEPLLVFTIETCVIVSGVRLWSRVKRPFPSYSIQVQWRPRTQNRTSVLRILLRVLLIAAPITAFVAVCLGVPSYASSFYTFVMSAGAILAGIEVTNWIARVCIQRVVAEIASTAEPSGRRSLRFSLQTLLLATPIVAVICAMAVRTAHGLPPQITEAWTTIVVDGLAGGCAVLLGAWMFAARRKWLAWPVALSLLLAMGAAVASVEWFIVSGGSWPPSPTIWNLSRSLFAATMTPLQRRDVQVWLAVTTSVGVLVLVCCSLASIAFCLRQPSPSATNRQRYRPSAIPRIVAGGLLVILLWFIISFPVDVTWKLLHPAPLPTIVSPNENGVSDVIAASAVFDASPILNTSVNPSSTAALKAEITKYATAYDQLHRGMQQPIRLLDWPSLANPQRPSKTAVKSIMLVRSAARALSCEAELANQEGRYDEAARISLATMQFGQETARDATNIEFAVGMAIEDIADHSLYEALPNFDATLCRQTRNQLEQLDKSRESLGDVIRRDRLWTENTFGWQGHFYELVRHMVWNDDQLHAHYWEATWRTEAVTRMLTIELALREFSLTRGKLPEKLDDLIPDYLESIPLDPFDPHRGGLRYVRTVDGHFIYSVGRDGVDNAGHSTEMASGIAGDGEDLRLDVFLAPEPTAPTSAGPNANTQQADDNQEAAEPDK